MYKKVMTYTDYNGEERTEDFYFNLTKAEITEMELMTDGGLKDKIERITKAKDVPEIIKLFKELILKAYGIKSPDGKRFIKSEKLVNACLEKSCNFGKHRNVGIAFASFPVTDTLKGNA